MPLTVRDSERSAQRELLSILRLVDAGKVTVSDKTRWNMASPTERSQFRIAAENPSKASHLRTLLDQNPTAACSSSASTSIRSR